MREGGEQGTLHVTVNRGGLSLLLHSLLASSHTLSGAFNRKVCLAGRKSILCFLLLHLQHLSSERLPLLHACCCCYFCVHSLLAVAELEGERPLQHMQHQYSQRLCLSRPSAFSPGIGAGCLHSHSSLTRLSGRQDWPLSLFLKALLAARRVDWLSRD